jgi:hypothetical protein
MNPEVIKIGNKLFKTELATQKVELGSVKELEFQLKQLKSWESDMLKEAGKYMDILTSLEKQYQIANGKRNGANREAGNSLAVIESFKNNAKNLGIDVSNIKELKELQDMIKKTFDNQKDFDANITKP